VTCAVNTIRTESWARVSINNDIGARQIVGSILRRLADFIDKRKTLAVDILTLPPLTDQQRTQCMSQGTRAIIAAVRSEAESEALESIMRDYCGRLYTD
jgi:hypothetical protein